MDSTMKKYEHQQLRWVCEHECNVGEKYVLPQAQAFGLGWSMPMDQSYSLRCTEECHLSATGWRSPPDPTDKQTDGEDQIVAPTLELISGSRMPEQPPVKQGTCLKIC